jgi:GNAT superfamily N-acetyltransferase
MTSASDHEVLALRDADDATLDRFYPLLEAAFGPEELMTLEELRDARQDPGTTGTLVQAGDEPVASMITEEFLDGRVVLLAYLVVAASARSGGLGSKLLAELPRPDAGAETPLVLAEIEDPRVHASSDRGDPAARVRFYDRAGARLLPLPYAQPALRPGSPRVDGMLLITLGTTKENVDGRTVAAFLEEYFVGCEGEEVRSDPAFTELYALALGDEHNRLALHSATDLDAARRC